MQTLADRTLARIAQEIESGQADMANLGGASGTSVLPLDTAPRMAQYAQILTPSVLSALHANRRLQSYVLVLLSAVFVLACALTWLAHARGWGWVPAAVIPGLGVTAVWPIRVVLRLREQNTRLTLFPLLLPLLTPDDARRLARKLTGLDS